MLTTKKMSIAAEFSDQLAGMERKCGGAGIGKVLRCRFTALLSLFCLDSVLDPKGKLNK